jgi:hypothetical protein
LLFQRAEQLAARPAEDDPYPLVAEDSCPRRAQSQQDDNCEEDVMPHNRGTRRKPRYVGLVSYKGHTMWVGTHPSIAAYKQAEHDRLIELGAAV